MTNEYSPFDGSRRTQPAPVLIKRLWRLRRVSGGKILSCGLYLHPYGIEARCGYRNEDDLLMSVVEKSPDAAKEMADEWKRAAIDKGFTEMNG